jgi:hypothetical protein
MSTIQELEERLRLLEQEVREIQDHLNLPRRPWWQMMKPIPEEMREDFQKAMEEARRQLNVEDWPLEEADEDWTE